ARRPPRGAAPRSGRTRGATCPARRPWPETLRRPGRARCRAGRRGVRPSSWCPTPAGRRPSRATPGRALACSAGEGLEQRLALLLAQALDPARVGDADLLHRPPGADLAHAGERLEDRDDLHLPDRVVALGLAEEVPQGQGPHLELLLQLGTGTTGFGGLGQCVFTLLRSQLRWLRHGGQPSARARATRAIPTARRAQTRDATSRRAASTGSSARVTGRPTTSRSAPASSAARGVATRPWSSAGAPSGRMPGVASTARGASWRTVATSGTAQTKPWQPPSSPAATRWCSRCSETSGSLVRTVTPRPTGSRSARARAAPSRRPSMPARTIAGPPAVWTVR